MRKVKILFHITGYHNSCQFEWLYRAIYSKYDLFILHVDKKAPKHIHDGFRRVAGCQDNVIFLPSQAVTWGGCGLIDVEMMAIRHALRYDPSWTHIVNLSAQDYPLVPTSALKDELAICWPLNFVLCNDIRQVHWRIRKRPLLRYVEWYNRRICTPIPKIAPKRLKIRSVGPWWHILTRDFCSWLITDSKAREYLSFLRSAGMPDELLIQNTILDSPFQDQVLSCCKHEILWRRPGEPRSSSARPKVFTIEDLPRLQASTAFFARKFDYQVDQNILTTLASRHHFDVPRLVEPC